MARPIKETPILKGKDAVNFLQNMKDAEHQRVSVCEREKIKEAYNKIQRLVKF